MTDQLEPLDVRSGDAEVIEVTGDVLGGPVDPPEERQTLYANVVNRRDQDLAPIIPAEWRNPDQRREVLRWMVWYAGYQARFHSLRSPKYAGKMALYTPRGFARALAKLVKWAMAEEGNWHLRQQAANQNNPEEWRRLNNVRARESRARWIVVAIGATVLTAAFILLWAGVIPSLAQWVVLAAAIPVLARVGRPADKPITDRVVTSARFVKLTGEMVRNAVASLGIQRVKEPGDIDFPPPGIHRDGPGWLARFNLPGGVEAIEVLDKRGRLSSALRLPVDQVWPTAGPEHAGQVDLWVGYVPASKMKQPRWSLASPTARTSVFAEHDFGSDQRQRPIGSSLIGRNWLIGGRPGSGKSYAARTVATIAALDPTCELKIVEYKGTGDFLDFEPLCSTYACGLAEEDMATGLGILTWGLAEAERRGARIKAAKQRGEAPEGKVTPELAARPGSGLHPVFILIDEAHELFGDSDVGKAAGEAAVRLAKRGRALGIMLCIVTQIPDKDSLPPTLNRVMAMRWCLAVSDWWANDAILGTGAYKRGISATVYRPDLDAGWGMLMGLAEPIGVRAQYPDQPTTKAILGRAAQLRGGKVGSDIEVASTRDVLDDVIRVFATVGRPGVHWQTLAGMLGELAPEAYADITPEAISALLRSKGVPSEDVKVDGVNLKGCKRREVEAAMERREISGGR